MGLSTCKHILDTVLDSLAMNTIYVPSRLMWECASPLVVTMACSCLKQRKFSGQMPVICVWLERYKLCRRQPCAVCQGEEDSVVAKQNVELAGRALSKDLHARAVPFTFWAFASWPLSWLPPGSAFATLASIMPVQLSAIEIFSMLVGIKAGWAFCTGRKLFLQWAGKTAEKQCRKFPLQPVCQSKHPQISWPWSNIVNEQLLKSCPWSLPILSSILSCCLRKQQLLWNKRSSYRLVA